MLSKRYCAYLLLCLIFASSTYANCPPTKSIKYGCSSSGGKKHCNWSAPWYEGFPEEGANPGDVARDFYRVFWATNATQPTPTSTGSTICFFQSPHGHLIELVQNRWGGVITPESTNWTTATWQDKKGKECGYGYTQEQCKFNYPD